MWVFAGENTRYSHAQKKWNINSTEITTVAVSRFFAMTVCKLTIITEIQDQFFITCAPVFALHLQVI